MGKQKYIDRNSVIFSKVADHAETIVDVSALRAVPMEELTGVLEAELGSVLGAGAGSLMSGLLRLDDVKAELEDRGIFTIPVVKAFFQPRLRTRALNGYTTKAGDLVDPDPVKLIPVGYGKQKAGLADGTHWIDLSGLWMDANMKWRNGSVNAFDTLTTKALDANAVPPDRIRQLLSSRLSEEAQRSEVIRRLMESRCQKTLNGGEDHP